MKTQRILLFSIALFLFSCSKETPAENSEPEIMGKTEMANASAKPSNLITLEKAKEQLDNYNQAHPDELGKEYALRSWISLDDIKAYIQYVEESSAEKGIEVTGIDIIHTQYKNAAPGSGNPHNEHEKTLMLAPTYQKDSVNIAFDPIYSEYGKPKDLKELLSEFSSNSGPEEKGGKKSSIANMLTTCPNNCD